MSLTANPEKPLVAISSCLLGHPVRYDGRSRKDDFIVKTLSALFEWLPVCPETAIGLGTPRPPIQLVRGDRGLRVVGVENPEQDVTDALGDFARRFAAEGAKVRGCILKARSPSCAVQGLPVFGADGERTPEMGQGEFARVLASIWPDKPFIDEEGLRDPRRRAAFIRAVGAHS